MSDVKEVKLSGGALVKAKTRRTSTRKNRQNGGDNSGGLTQLAAQSAPAMKADMNVQEYASQIHGQVKSVLTDNFGPGKQWGGRKQQGGDSTGATVNLSSTRAPTLPGSPAPIPVISGIAVSQPAPVQGGGVVLAPPKRKTRISLKGKKYKGGMTEFNNVPPQPGGGHTRKARKIHLRVKGVTSRLVKAKKAKKTAESAPLSVVKHKLESAGVIKKGSKAPESMLRTMYADLLITKKGL